MQSKYKEYGGGPATGLADSFVRFLQQGLETGSFGAGTAAQRSAGANPVGDTMGIAGILNDILAGGAGQMGGSMNEMIQRQNERDVLGLRARFGAQGGTAFGTPAAFAESLYRAEAAPRATQAIGGMQMQMLSQLLPLFANMASKGITQREGAMTPSPFASVIGSIAPAAGLLMGGFSNPFGGGGGGMPNLSTMDLFKEAAAAQIPQITAPQIVPISATGGYNLPLLTSMIPTLRAA